jgi:uncharacterized protein (DUF2147 family)
MRHHAFAAAMGLVTAAMLAPCSQSQAASADPTGYWYKPDAERESKIQVSRCGASKAQLCAKIIWLKDPMDSKGKALHDIRNEDPSMRDRPIVGLTIFAGLTPSAPATWTGKIYNPEDGHTYAATLTMVSRTQITLRGCKAWLLCGEKQWLRTSAPPAAVPATAPEGTEQIEASAKPDANAPAAATATAAASPAVPAKTEQAAAPAAPTVEAAADQAAPAVDANPAPAAAPAPPAEAVAAASPSAAPAPAMQAAVEPAPSMSQPVALVSPAPQGEEQRTQKGYGFLNASMTSETATKYSGENVSSMFNMTSPIPAQAATQGTPTQGAASSAPATQTAAVSAAPTAQPSAATQAAAADPVPLPEQKPKVKVKPQAVAAKSTPKTTTTAAAPATDDQGAPVPDDGMAAQADAGTQSAQADATEVEPVPLTRRQMRKLRRQQEQQEPFLPWLR